MHYVLPSKLHNGTKNVVSMACTQLSTDNPTMHRAAFYRFKGITVEQLCQFL